MTDSGGYEVKTVDNGRGIPKEEIGRITEAFYMVDKSRSRKEGGAGIGMALCQRIIQLHGASMQIDSLIDAALCCHVELFSIRKLCGETEKTTIKICLVGTVKGSHIHQFPRSGLHFAACSGILNSKYQLRRQKSHHNK